MIGAQLAAISRFAPVAERMTPHAVTKHSAVNIRDSIARASIIMLVTGVPV
jgi:hypothetical protein